MRHESFDAKLANGLQHGKSWLAVEIALAQDQTLIEQRADQVEGRRSVAARLVASWHPRRDVSRGLEIKAAGKHGQVAEERLLVRGEEIVGPSDGLPQRALALREIARPRCEKGQTRREPFEQHPRGKEFGSCRRQLDSQRQ